MYFHLKFEKKNRKTQGLLKKLRKKPRSSWKNPTSQGRIKNPRSWEKIQGVATLVRDGWRRDAKIDQRRPTVVACENNMESTATPMSGSATSWVRPMPNCSILPTSRNTALG